MTSPPYHGAVVVSWCGPDVTCVDTAHSDVALSGSAGDWSGGC